MTTETFAFTVLAAILGMTVVFLFLGILSFLMYAIKEFFGDGDERADADGSGGVARSSAERGTDYDWVIAAAAAFVLEEQLDSRRSAAAWVPRPAGAADSWQNLPRF